MSVPRPSVEIRKRTIAISQVATYENKKCEARFVYMHLHLTLILLVYQGTVLVQLGRLGSEFCVKLKTCVEYPIDPKFYVYYEYEFRNVLAPLNRELYKYVQNWHRRRKFEVRAVPTGPTRYPSAPRDFEIRNPDLCP